jgi:diguanylate cyclase (GGDEF)-like protein
MDGFSTINQAHGYALGDALLHAIAARIRARVGAEDRVVHLAGDEFAVLAEVEEKSQITELAVQLLQDMRRSFYIDAQTIDVAASIGIAMEAGKESRGQHLLSHAASALAEAKDLGRNRYAVFNALDAAAASDIELTVGDLRRALCEQELFLVYQPKLDLQSGRVLGMEALMRWNHPEHGNIAPDNFIPLAEKTGMIVDIGRWALDEACRQMRAWRDEFTVDWSVSVNASVFQINAASFFTNVCDALARHGLQPRDLCIEITESDAMRNVELSMMTLHRLASSGVRISLDDFGVGYSSLSRLKRLPVQELKIDRSFISCIGDSREGAAIVKAIIDLGRAVGLHVVAEGVETAQQQSMLAGMKCDAIQGYLISRPIIAADVPALVANHNPTVGRCVQF